tara:strand:- start:362 stop:796 length:435 start_codon:yes stop_codon:yes gene_type:complete
MGDRTSIHRYQGFSNRLFVPQFEKYLSSFWSLGIAPLCPQGRAADPGRDLAPPLPEVIVLRPGYAHCVGKGRRIKKGAPRGVTVTTTISSSRTRNGNSGDPVTISQTILAPAKKASLWVGSGSASGAPIVMASPNVLTNAIFAT